MQKAECKERATETPASSHGDKLNAMRIKLYKCSSPPNCRKGRCGTNVAHLYVCSLYQMQHTYTRWNIGPSRVVHNQCTVRNWGPGCLPRLFQLKCWKFICWRLTTSCTRKSGNEETSEYQRHQLQCIGSVDFQTPSQLLQTESHWTSWQRLWRPMSKSRHVRCLSYAKRLTYWMYKCIRAS